jgi:hypothetical protein
MVLPDYVAETYEPRLETGGEDSRDGSGHALRYMAWSHPPAADETAFDMDFAIMLRGADGVVQLFHDRHRLGLFPRATWQQAFVRAGFAAPHVMRDPWGRDVMIATPAGKDAAGTE